MLALETEVILADRTVSRIQAALRDDLTACIAQVVELIREISSRPDTISVQHLAELIERDVAVVAEILRIANTIGYNPEGVEIGTVVQAIQIIGFTKIRNLAVSLLLLQHAGQLANGRESREMSALAVTCGHLAEVGSERMGLVEAGHAFVCVALRRYGELLLSTFLPEDYHEARQRAVGVAGNRAWAEVFGLSLLELGRRVLETMNLPQGILATLRELPPAKELDQLPEEEVKLAAATDLALRVTSWMAGEGPRETSLEALSAGLVRRYGTAMGLEKGMLQEIVEEVDRRLSALRGPLGSVPVLDRVRSVALGKPLIPGGDPGLPPGGAVGGAGQVAVARPKTIDATRILMEGIAEISDLLAATPVRGGQVYRAGARRVMAALGLVDCWVFRRHAGDSVLEPFLGAGPFFPQLPVKARIEPQERTVFTVCVQRAEIVLLSLPEDPKIRPFVPDWVIAVAGTAPLLLLPVGRPGDVMAVLCGVSEAGRLDAVAANVRQQLQVMAKLLALAKDA